MKHGISREAIELIDPSELKAIMDHKWYLSERAGRPVSIEDAILDFRERYRNGWLQSKLEQENREQIDEIIKYKWYRSEEEGHDIGKDRAAFEWITGFADLWRQRKGILEANGFITMEVVVEKEEGVTIRPASRLSELSQNFDCEIYLRTGSTEYCNFILNHKGYLNVRSVICPLSLTFEKGDRIEFIAMGVQAPEALEALRLFLTLLTVIS